ncbi:MAG: ABC transporter ATP-binding protein [Oligoflexia bacterium]|nr:ABC transporter ATP-binding protein [Oligoflexia bacterium]
MGPSGCGKTTLLRIIAGHDTPTQGRVILNGQDITNVKPHERPIHTVFQRYALFPHMNVFDNIAFGLRCQNISESEISKKVDEVLELVNLKNQGHRQVTQLSGGEQQRVSLVRALVNRPQLLLLDEPLGALDHKLRLQLQTELVAIQRKFKTTFVFVTHDQQEALNMSDKVVLLNLGKVEQQGSPHEIYESPKTLFAAQFVGNINCLKAQAKEKVSELEMTAESSDLGIFKFEVNGQGFDYYASGVSGSFCVRPEKMMIYSKKPTTMANVVEGKIKAQTYLGTYTQFEVVLKNGSTFIVFQQNTQKLPKKVFKNEDHVFLGWQSNASHFFKE